MEEQFDPESKDMLLQFMGQTYGELHKLDSFIVGSSSQLQPKSEAFKQTVANVTRSINSNVPQQAQNPQTQPPRSFIHREAPHAQDAAVPVDPNQMEFGFDNSATAVGIDKALVRIEDKLERLTKAVSKILELNKK